MLSAEIESLYESVKAKFASIPEEVHTFFMGESLKAKADEQAAEAEETKIKGEIEHLTSVGYSVVKVAEVVAAPAAPVIGAPVSVTTA